MHHRRARPTLRVLREDLTSGWTSPQPQRALADGRLPDLHPLSELPHPIIAKAKDAFGADPADDNYVGPIACSRQLHLREIKQSQWRGGVWEDPDTHVCWLVVGGLAKGDHQDRDDFYQRLEREDQTGDPTRWLPTDDDLRLLKQETAARLRTTWELDTQHAVLDALRAIHAGGTTRLHFHHPIPGQGHFAHADITVQPVRETDYQADEILVEITPQPRYAASNLLWQLTLRILISLEPPEQRWDRYGNTYANIAEPGAWHHRAKALSHLDHTGQLEASQPGTTSHYSHRKHLAGSTINGHAVRALCGTYFVPHQDHQTLPTCPTCQQRLNEL
ncbi:DUF3039 domain-containing protein [Arsenicicoccus cauae]|uniref:DUF3039 domain-containing protein n=1 Tax=Arsenicicoccus cauae TaxID=2663847 RepID=UPI00370DE16B